MQNLVNDPSLHRVLLLTDDSAFVVLVGVEASVLLLSCSIKVVVGLLNHVGLVCDFLLLEGPFEDVDVGVVLKLHT